MKQNLKALADAITERYRNFPIAEVNTHCVRLAVNEDATYEWHHHPGSDELFLVLEGELTIEFRDQAPSTLHAGDFLNVPAGKTHRTIAKGRTVNLCFEASDAQTVFAEA